MRTLLPRTILAVALPVALLCVTGCDDESPDRATQEVHAGAIDDRPLVETNNPQDPAPKRPPKAPADSPCNCTLSALEGPATVEPRCPSNPRKAGDRIVFDPSATGPVVFDPQELNADPATFEGYDGDVTYKVAAECTDGASLVEIQWDKTADAAATQHGSSRYRWCDDNGVNTIGPEATPRSHFWCHRNGQSSTLKAPMCSEGTYTICAYAIFQCEGQEGQVSSQPACMNVVSRT